ncbi:MAG TPA: potassium channel family protein [Pyrinomonadaceae bacterium]|nr:potassium channel family protein [Pyrinomonadaceae bacterium]
MLKELALAFGVVSICLGIHTAGLVVLAERVLRRRTAFEREPDMAHFILQLIKVFAIIILLHVVETAIWAGFYRWRELFPDYETSLYFSLTSYSTIGYGDVLLTQKWRLLGCVEGISGVLLCGLSTAFIFVVVDGLIRIRRQQQIQK